MPARRRERDQRVTQLAQHVGLDVREHERERAGRRASPTRRALADVVGRGVLARRRRPRSDRCRPRRRCAPGHRLTAAIARMPEPQPTSRMRAGAEPPSASAWISSSTSRVLACVPVPNAMPGSRSIAMSSGPGVKRSQLGTTTNWRVSRLTLKYFFHASRHSASGIAAATRTRAGSTRERRRLASARPRRAPRRAPPRPVAATQNTTSSPRCSVPAAAAGTSEAISAAMSSTSAAPTGTTTLDPVVGARSLGRVTQRAWPASRGASSRGAAACGPRGSCACS